MQFGGPFLVIFCAAISLISIVASSLHKWPKLNHKLLHFPCGFVRGETMQNNCRQDSWGVSVDDSAQGEKDTLFVFDWAARVELFDFIEAGLSQPLSSNKS